MSKTPVWLIKIISAISVVLPISMAYTHKPSATINHGFSAVTQIQQQQKPKSKNTVSHSISTKNLSDTTFALKIENEKRVVDDPLKAKLIHDLKAAISKHQLKKPYKIAMGFTKGARDVETFLFGEQIFYTLAESGFAITGTPLDMPDESPNPIPQIKVLNNTIYVILSKM